MEMRRKCFRPEVVIMTDCHYRRAAVIKQRRKGGGGLDERIPSLWHSSVACDWRNIYIV